MKLIFYGGVNEIGGNKILLEVSKTKIFLDFGEPFNRGDGIYFGFEYVSPREKLGLKDYFEFDLIPDLEGLYAKEELKFTNLKYTNPKFDAILISHIHADHFGDVADVDPKIPVYLGYGANRLNDVFNEIYPSFKTEHNGNIVEIKSGNKFKIKNVEVIPVHMDHSVPGAYGFIIKTEEGNIAYTGDYRFHGFKPDLTEDFIKVAKKEKTKILITEGTRVKKQIDKRFDNKINEQDVENKFYEAIKKSNGSTFVNFSFRNIDRVRSLYNAAVRAGKILVANPGFFYTIDCAREIIDDLPKVKNNPNIRVFKKDGDIEEYKKTREYAKPYLEKSVDYKWIRKHLNDVVMFLTASELSQLIDIKPKKGMYVFSMSEHYLEGEDNEEYRNCLEYWLDHFGLDFAQIHCSGHAGEDGIKRMINEIEPQIVIPVHTEAAEKFKNFWKKVILPEKEQIVVIK